MLGGEVDLTNARSSQMWRLSPVAPLLNSLPNAKVKLPEYFHLGFSFVNTQVQRSLR